MIRGCFASTRGDRRLPLRLFGGFPVIGDASAREHFSQAPVHHLDLAEAAHHHVRRLQVAMDHAARMGIGHRLRDGGEDREESGQVVGRGWTGPEKFGQRSPSHQLHSEEWPVVFKSPQLVDRHHAGMLQLSADLRFLDETPDQVEVAAEVFSKHLEGHVATELMIATSEHGPHAAATDLAVDPVTNFGISIGHGANQ